MFNKVNEMVPEGQYTHHQVRSLMIETGRKLAEMDHKYQTYTAISILGVLIISIITALLIVYCLIPNLN